MLNFKHAFHLKAYDVIIVELISEQLQNHVPIIALFLLNTCSTIYYALQEIQYFSCQLSGETTNWISR